LVAALAAVITLSAADGLINALSFLAGILSALIAVIAYYRFGRASRSCIAGIFGAGIAVITAYLSTLTRPV